MNRKFYARSVTLAIWTILLVFAQMQVVSQQQGPEPGATDPLGKPSRYTLFADDEIAGFVPGSSAITLRTIKPDAKLKLGNQVAQNDIPSDSVSAEIVSAAGRILTPNHADVVYARRSGSKVHINFGTHPTSTELSQPLAERVQGCSDFLAIAAGDLDKVADRSGNNHDEVAVFYVTHLDRGLAQYTLSILDYTSNASDNYVSPVAITSTSFQQTPPFFSDSPSSTGILPSDNILGVAIGDFDGDGQNEIAVAAVTHIRQVTVYTYRYTNNAGVRTLKRVNESFYTTESDNVATIGVKAGDFNGDGIDELLVSYAVWERVPYEPIGFVGRYRIGSLIFQGDPNLKMTLRARTVSQIGTTDRQYAADTRPHVEAATGQFLFSPPGIPFGQRQFLLSWNDPGRKGVTVQAYTVSKNLAAISSLGPPLEVPAAMCAQRHSLAAGGFIGNADTSKPLWSAVLGIWTSQSLTGRYDVISLAVGANGVTAADTRTYTTDLLDSSARFPVNAYDWLGRSVFLGAPIHLTVEGGVNTDFVLEEPPKHAYYDERAKQVVNVTRFDRNNVHLISQKEGSFASTTKDHTNWNIGASTAISAGATVSAGFDIGLASGSAEASADVSAKGSYDYNQSESSYNSKFGSRAISATGQTDRDDYVKGRLQILDVWRYRVYGIRQTLPDTNNFYDLVLPGPWLPFANGGLNYTWYQPIHENGNILSYPQALGSTPGNPFIPDDLGPFMLPDGKKGTGPQVPASQSFFDGTSHTSTLKYSDEVAGGRSFEYDHTLAKSLDVTSSLKVSGGFRGIEGEARISAQVEFHNTNSWGKTTTSDNKTTNLTEITLNRAPGDANKTYPFYPVVYSSTDGTIKMAHAISNPAERSSNPNAFTFWADTYGGEPDPALNLPRHFAPAIGTEPVSWEPNFGSNRKYMRGLFFRRPELDKVSKSYDFFADAPVDGENVRVEARIYNYSTSKRVIDVPVLFQAIAYDSSNNSEMCANPINGYQGRKSGLLCPATARRPIGEARVPELEPLQFTCLEGNDKPDVTGCASPLFINWNTKGFGPGKGISEYRIYVVLDPDNTIEQIYGGEGPPVAVSAASNTSPIEITTAKPHGLQSGDYVTIGGVQGNDAANGIFRVAVSSQTSFFLSSSAGNGGYEGGGVATLLDPGQNNEGYGYISIASPPGPTVFTDDNTPHDYLKNDSVMAVSDRGADSLTGEDVIAYLDRPLQIRVSVYTTKDHDDALHLLLYDGDPNEGAVVLADTFVVPQVGATNVWLNWTPDRAGTHHLTAQVMQLAADAQPGDNIAQLNVSVLQPGDVNGDGVVNRLDLDLLLKDLNKRADASACGLACDLDGDGQITALDARRLVLLCSNTGCSSAKP